MKKLILLFCVLIIESSCGFPSVADKSFRDGYQFAMKKLPAMVYRVSDYNAYIARLETKQPKLKTCRPELKLLYAFTYEMFEGRLTTIECNRSLEKQKENFRKGLTKTMRSLHLANPSNALDFSYCEGEPYSCKKINWNDTEQVAFVQGVMRATFVFLKVEFLLQDNWANLCLRNGVDWSSDGDICSKKHKNKKNCFPDYFHVELRDDGKGYCDTDMIDVFGINKYS